MGSARPITISATTCARAPAPDTFANGPLGVTAVKTGTGTEYFTRDPQGNLLDEHDSTGSRDFVNDANGSVLALFRAAGTAVGAYTYSPYGDTTVLAESGGTTASIQPFRYIGGYYDTEGDGYYKLGARYYDKHGHFTQPDPQSLATGGYTYTSGDPINSSDPSGALPKLVPDSLGKAFKVGDYLGYVTDGFDAVDDFYQGDVKGGIADILAAGTAFAAGVGCGVILSPLAETGLDEVACPIVAGYVDSKSRGFYKSKL